VDTETGEYGEQRLEHSEGAEKFYRDLAAQGKKIRVGMEASGHARWFERLLAELNFELVDRGRQRDRQEARTQAEDGSAGCAAYSAVADGESFSQDLDTEWGESGPAATVVASASHGADADSDHESTASGGSERGATLQKEVVAEAWTRATGVVPVSPLGEPATGRSAAAAGSAEPDHSRSDASDRAGGREMSGGTALADASWSGCTDGFSLRLNHRKDGAISVREADRGISGVSALGGLKRQSATTGPYHKAREFDVAFPAGGSGPSYST